MSQMAERDEALQTATAGDGRAKAAMSELLQQKEVLIRDNEACEAAISDVMERKQVLLLATKAKCVPAGTAVDAWLVLCSQGSVTPCPPPMLML